MIRRFITSLLSISCLFAIDAHFKSESLSGSLGDVISFGWDIQHPEDAIVSILDVDTETTGIEIIETQIIPFESGSSVVFQTAVYDSVGIYSFPSTMAYIQDKASVDSIVLKGPDIEITSVLAPSDTTFRDIKSIHNIKTPYNLVILLYVLGAAGLIYLLYILLKRFGMQAKEKLPEKVVVPPEEAHVIALRALNSLKRSKYIRFEQYKEFYSELTHVLKQYYENRYLVDALEQTTSEFLDTMRSMHDFDSQLISDTQLILEKADFIKFAKGTSDELESGKSLSMAIDMVERTKVVLNQGENT